MPDKWEDQQPANYDAETLEREYRAILYSDKGRELLAKHSLEPEDVSLVINGEELKKTPFEHLREWAVVERDKAGKQSVSRPSIFTQNMARANAMQEVINRIDAITRGEIKATHCDGCPHVFEDYDPLFTVNGKTLCASCAGPLASPYSTK